MVKITTRIISSETMRKAEQIKIDFYQALGEMIIALCHVEKELLDILFTLTEVPPYVGAAVFSGLHSNQTREHIKRVIGAKRENGDDSDYSILLASFGQIGIITGTRNDIVHAGVQFWLEEDPRIYTGQRAHLAERVRDYRLSAEHLRDMIWDLRKAQTHFTVQFAPPDQLFFLMCKRR